MSDNDKVKALKAEIEEYHRQAEIQNKEILETATAKRAYQSAAHWAILIWCVLLLITALWVSLNTERFTGIDIKDALPYAFMTSVSSYLAVNSISLFVSSMSSKIQDYTKWKIKRTAIVFLLVAFVIAVFVVRWWLTLGA